MRPPTARTDRADGPTSAQPALRAARHVRDLRRDRPHPPRDQLGRSTVAAGASTAAAAAAGRPRDRLRDLVIPDLTPGSSGLRRDPADCSAFAGVVRGPGGFLYGATSAEGQDPWTRPSSVRCIASTTRSAIDEEHGFSGADGSTPYARAHARRHDVLGASVVGDERSPAMIFRTRRRSRPERSSTCSFVGPRREGPRSSSAASDGSTIHGGATIFRVRTDGDYGAARVAVTARSPGARGDRPRRLAPGRRGVRRHRLRSAGRVGRLRNGVPPGARDGRDGSRAVPGPNSFTEQARRYRIAKLLRRQTGVSTGRLAFTPRPGRHSHEVVDEDQSSAPIRVSTDIDVARWRRRRRLGPRVFHRQDWHAGHAAASAFDADVAWSPYGILCAVKARARSTARRTGRDG